MIFADSLKTSSHLFTNKILDYNAQVLYSAALCTCVSSHLLFLPGRFWSFIKPQTIMFAQCRQGCLGFMFIYGFIFLWVIKAYRENIILRGNEITEVQNISLFLLISLPPCVTLITATTMYCSLRSVGSSTVAFVDPPHMEQQNCSNPFLVFLCIVFFL